MILTLHSAPGGDAGSSIIMHDMLGEVDNSESE